ncbi:MAG: alpha-ketoglutarate-dependent dioxygenase AlkB [Bacteroidia bacterium]|nr:alpha-ketoglutarate-dependent dioxygenase AlkB [Bacteroidia bacterium]
MMTDKVNLLPRDGELYYYPNYINEELGKTIWEYFQDYVEWRKDTIRIFGKTYPLPRLQDFFGDEEKLCYTYSSIPLFAKPWPESLLRCKNKIEHDFNIQFNCALVNYYRDGHDSNGRHSDDEPELGKNPILASVSLGAERKFRYFHKTENALKYHIMLRHGDLLIMKGAMQHHWFHEIPKEKKVKYPRLNITFRRIVMDTLNQLNLMHSRVSLKDKGS